MAERKADLAVGGVAAFAPSTRAGLPPFVAPLVLTIATSLIFVWSETKGPELHMARASFVWFGLVVVLGVVAAHRGALAVVGALVAPVRANPVGSSRVFVTAVTLALLLIAGVVLDGFATSGDEYSYLLQADTFLSGRLWVDAPPVGEAFRLMRFVEKDGRWLSIYQPGWALLLAIPKALYLPPWVINPLLGGGMAWAFFRLASRLVRVEAAWLVLLGLVTSSFFLFNFACMMAHGAGAFTAVLFALFGTRYVQEGASRDALLAGICLGALGFIRAPNAVLLVGPFVVALLLTRGRRIGLLWFALGGIPFVLALLTYNKLITGDPFLAVQIWVAPGREPIGAASSSGGSFLAETWRRLVRLYFWTSPAFLLGWVAAFGYVAWRRKLSFVDWMAPLTVVGFAFYGGNGGNQFGPRYYFEGWPLALITVAKAVEGLFAERLRHGAVVAACLVSHLAFQLGYLIPRVQREYRIAREREDVFTQVAAAKLTNAVVLIVDSPNDDVRMLRPLPGEDLVRNGLAIGDQPVLYALDRRPEVTARLFEHFSGRQFYRYYRGTLQRAQDAAGRLLPKPSDGK